MNWLLHEKKETEKTDWCSWFPDVLLGFQFYRACKIHDYLYRGRSIPQYGSVDSRWRADWIAFKMGLKIIEEGSKSLLHYLIGLLLNILFLVGIRLGGFYAWYSKR